MPGQAVDARNAFTKAMYSFLFDWLVEALNNSLGRRDGSAQTSGAFIAVLDIFGFEAFEENSFEQLLINYCNEKLLAHFNSYIFVMEQEEYKREGISVQVCDFRDNSETIAMLEKVPSGLLSLLDEEIQIPKGSDEKLLDKIISKHSKKDLLSRAMARKEKHSHAKFVVTHFAGEVAYDIRGFLEKNKDALPATFIDIGASSSVPFIAELFKVRLLCTACELKNWDVEAGVCFKYVANNLFFTCLLNVVFLLIEPPRVAKGGRGRPLLW